MDINDLLQSSEDELFAQLGDALPKTRTLGDLTDRGKHWLNGNKKRIAEVICPKYSSLKNKSQSEAAIQIAATLGDFFSGMPVLVIAALLVKTGLTTLCKEKAV